jgi:dipeptidase D
MMFPLELKKEPVWRFFSDLCSIPRTSGNEALISDYLRSFARSRALSYDYDSPGNVIIRKPGAGETVALQAHMDMVGEKSTGSTHDFQRDPIEPVLEGDRLVALETTLGADNGIGVSLMLEFLDGNYPGMPPLECLFTVDEERGLVGALQFPSQWITARKLINLDSEDISIICIGCAGGQDVEMTLPVVTEEYNGPAVKITVDGLNGGHSGMEIGAGNANAIKLAIRTCRQLEELAGGRLVSFSGGSKHNAIPRNAEAVVAVEDVVKARSLCSRVKNDFLKEYSGIEETIEIRCEETKTSHRLSEDSSNRITDLLLALPHGVKEMSAVVHGLVETSCNLAIALWNGNSLSVLLSVRSAVESAKKTLALEIAALGTLANADIAMCEGYPGWAPDPASPLLATARNCLRECLGIEPVVEAIHAGLECGIIGKRVGNLDMISLGPNISDVHKPGESVSVSSVNEFLNCLARLLGKLAR